MAYLLPQLINGLTLGSIYGLSAIGDAAESSDHLVSPEDGIRIAMARQ